MRAAQGLLRQRLLRLRQHLNLRRLRLRKLCRLCLGSLRSLRSLRGRLSLGAFAAVLSLFALLSADPELRRETLSPGDLSGPHAALAERCEACHPAAEAGISGLARAALQDAPGQSQRCLECHAFGPDALNAHGLPQAEREAWSARVGDVCGDEPAPARLRASRALFPEHQAGLACSSCHREHRGRGANLQELTDKRCQSCHQRQFGDLSHGHPAFQAWGERAAGRLLFPHASHLEGKDSHFAEASQEAPACVACHTLDERGRQGVLRDNTFSRWCQQCHGGKEFSPIAVFQLPAIPLGWLERAGAWPRSADHDEDLDEDATEATPFMRTLLRTPRQGPQALSTLVERLREYASDPIEEGAAASGEWDGRISKEQRAEAYEEEAEALQAAKEEQKLLPQGRAQVWDTKALLAELAGERPLAQRWSKLPGVRSGPASLKAAEDLSATLPRPFLRALRASWLGKDTPQGPSRFHTPSALASPEARVRGGGLLRAGKGFRLEYRGYPHEDPLLTRFMTLAETLEPGSQRLTDLLASLRGRCTVCHRVEQGGAVKVRWKATRSQRHQRWVTSFAHRPHQNLGGKQTCTSCHELKPEPEKAPEPPPAGPHPSDFRLKRYATRADCLKCHQPQKAGQSCTQCHAYHVGHVPPARVPPKAE